MKLILQNLLKFVLYFLFNANGLNSLAKDMERRFRKFPLEEQSLLWKIKYLRQNIQYKTLVYYRLFYACRIPILKRVLNVFYQKSSEQTGVEFLTPFIGGGVIMPHWGRIILNAEQIGDDLYVFHNVTIGNDYTSGKPKIGSNVFIGTSSVILGGITIGNNVVIGACSFVNTDIPSNSIAAGSPAKVIRSIDDEYISKLIGY